MFEKFKKNYYSQNGEDGIIQELIKLLNINDNSWCCEFGAWDGKNSSNTFYLIEKNNFNAVYIESNKKKFEQLKKTQKKYNKILAINEHVERNNNSVKSIDNILSNTPIPKYFELLSIDIDSYDLDVWDSLKNYFPKIVIIEINSSIKPGIYSKHGSASQGNSFSSTVKIAKQKGYKLICHTGNCIFIRNDLINKLNIDEKYLNFPELLFDKSWLYKKESRLKILIKKILPNFLISYLKKIKRLLNF